MEYFENILNRDILYEIMLTMNIYDIKNLCAINKMANIICNDNSFWKVLYNRNFHSYTPISTDYKLSYQSMVHAEDLINIINDIYGDKSCGSRDVIHLYFTPMLYTNELIDAMMLPDRVVDVIDNENRKFSYFYITRDYNGTLIYKMTLKSYTVDVLPLIYITINDKEVIDFFVKLFYNYPHIVINDRYNIPYLYNDLLKYIKNNNNNIAICRLNYWKKYYNIL